MHQAARRMAPAGMAKLLLDAGASATAEFEGVTPYSMARVYGNRDLAPGCSRPAGAATGLNREEALLARAADGWTARANTSTPPNCPRPIAT
jgi:hypothetical protein